MPWRSSKAGRRAGLAALSVWLTVCGNAQSPQPVQVPSPPLLRLERVQPGRWSCVLVRANGRYHRESIVYETTTRSSFYEGALSANELAELNGILSSDKLVHLNQKDIQSPFVEDGSDVLRLAIFRSAVPRQDLLFPSPEFAFPGTVGPVLHWLDRMQKHSGRKLSEDAGRNSCAIPGEKEIRLTNRPRGAAKPVNPQ